LNEKLNKTYVPYGAKGREKARRQIVQDQKSKSISSALLSKRIQAKASAMYDNSKWDLVDALETGKVELDKIEESELPAELRKMSKGKRKDYVENMVKERKEIKKQIGRLSQERNKYVAGKRKEMNAPSVATMDQAITSAVQKQGGAKKFVF